MSTLEKIVELLAEEGIQEVRPVPQEAGLYTFVHKQQFTETFCVEELCGLLQKYYQKHCDNSSLPSNRPHWWNSKFWSSLEEEKEGMK